MIEWLWVMFLIFGPMVVVGALWCVRVDHLRYQTPWVDDLTDKEKPTIHRRHE